jgi:electron transfer flavoprotein alpha subunit
MANTLMGEISAVVIGDQVEALVPSLREWGVNRAYLVQGKELGFYNPLAFTEIITDLVKRFGVPESILFGATYLGQDLAPAVAARLETGCAAHCCDLKLGEDGNLHQIIPGLGGTIFGTIVTPDHRPQVATVKAGMLEMEEGIKKEVPLDVVKVEYQASGAASAISLSQSRPKPLQKASLGTAKRIVAGGAGVGSRENWALIEELAEAMDAVVGGTRPALDEGWIDHDGMIGSSGVTVRPELYLGVGISGDMMHTVGLKGKGIRVAVNNDPKAAIFKQVDFGIVGDIKEIVPALIQEVRRRKS